MGRRSRFPELWARRGGANGLQRLRKNVEVSSPTIGRQLLEPGLIDEMDLHIAPIPLGDGIRLFDNPRSEPIRLGWPVRATMRRPVNVRYRPITTARLPPEGPPGN